MEAEALGKIGATQKFIIERDCGGRKMGLRLTRRI